MGVGIIGCGEIGVLRPIALIRLATYRLQVVNHTAKDRARIVADRCEAYVELDWRSLGHREEVDAVIVSTPPHIHAEMCIEVLKWARHAPYFCAQRFSGRKVATPLENL